MALKHLLKNQICYLVSSKACTIHFISKYIANICDNTKVYAFV